MHREIVERKRWIPEEQFLRALNFCMILPGPEAQQLAVYIGWLLHGTPGGVAAGALFVIPSIVVLLVLSWLVAAHARVPAVAGLLYGVQPVVIAIVAEAVLRIGRRALRHPALYLFAAGAFIAIYFFSVPFPLIVVGAAAGGLLLERALPGVLHPRRPGAGAGTPTPRRVPFAPAGRARRDDGRSGWRRRSARARRGRGAGGVPVHRARDSDRRPVRGAVGRAGRDSLAVAGPRGRPGPRGPVLHRGGVRHLRRGVRRARLHRAHGRERLRLAERHPDGAGAGAGRIDSGPAHHGHAVRRLPRSVEPARADRPARQRHPRSADHDLRHVPVLLHVHLRRGAVHRGARGPPPHPGGPGWRDRRGRRRDSQSGRLLREPGAVPRGRLAGPLGPPPGVAVVRRPPALAAAHPVPGGGGSAGRDGVETSGGGGRPLNRPLDVAATAGPYPW
ncbi:MAG: hypothetical protein DMF51_02290 [Acidobacteria bacterium]|nr:MAG: hypothetical protein DMF51_02290 [Acidobacteriota bacterium]